MAKKTGGTVSYLTGRTRNRTEVDFATSQFEDIQQEAATITDFSAVPTTPFDTIDSNPFQQRRRMSEQKLHELEEDMKKNGITSVIIGRRHPTDPSRVQIAYGHRRVEAARRAGLFTGYPILIKDLDDWRMRWLMIGENRQREDPSPLDDAYTLQSLLDADLTQEKAAEAFGISRGTLRDLVALLNDEPDIQQLVEDKPNTVRAARDLRKEQDPLIRAQAIQALRNGDISGNQVSAYLETLKQTRLQQQQASEQELSLLSTSIQATTETPVQNIDLNNTSSTDKRDEKLTEEEIFTTTSSSSNGKTDTPTTAKTIAPSSLVAQSKSESMDQLDQSRLKTMNRQFESIERRIKQRKERHEVVSDKTFQQLKLLQERVQALLEELTSSAP
jgi:ParB/RepB/Spo0J family partition protein